MHGFVLVVILLLSGCTTSQFKCLMAPGATVSSHTAIVSVDGKPHLVSTQSLGSTENRVAAWSQECPAQHYAMLLRNAKTPEEIDRVNDEMDRWRCENGWDKPARPDNPLHAQEWAALCASLHATTATQK